MGAIATGGGAVFGSGAFSSVQADRAVTLNVTDDTTALLGLSANNTDIANDSANGDGTELGIDGSSLNPSAITEFNNAFDITNNGTDGAKFVTHGGITASGAINSIDLLLAGDVGNDVGASNPWTAGDYVRLDQGATLVVGIAIDTGQITADTTENFTLTLEAADETADFSIAAGTDLGDETS